MASRAMNYARRLPPLDESVTLGQLLGRHSTRPLQVQVGGLSLIPNLPKQIGVTALAALGGIIEDLATSPKYKDGDERARSSYDSAETYMEDASNNAIIDIINHKAWIAHCVHLAEISTVQESLGELDNPPDDEWFNEDGSLKSAPQMRDAPGQSYARYIEWIGDITSIGGTFLQEVSESAKLRAKAYAE